MQREEIARLKGLKGRPKIKPSGIEKKTEATTEGKTGKTRSKRGRGSRRVRVDEGRIVSVDVPPGSRFEGYEDVVVQDLVVRAHVVRFRRQRWLTPAGETIIAPLPACISGQFGPELKRFVLALYHQGQTTMPRLVVLLNDIGLVIFQTPGCPPADRRQAAVASQAEAREVLQAGMAHTAWISVDDTGARHQGRNAVTTQIGNDAFSWFATTKSKTRLNFLELLSAGHDDYMINGAALDYYGSP